MKAIERIKKDRIDLTNYLIHFTRCQNFRTTSFEVLKRIIEDGYIKAGWSERGKRKTIFGNKPAVCFTEAPLYGFVDYVTKRGDSFKIDNYGFAFLRKDLFKAGARNVIYGTSRNPIESCENDFFHVEGFSKHEQYRYILTTGVDEVNDWMHEREWRWADHHPRRGPFNHFALWTTDQMSQELSQIIIIVRRKTERKTLVELFKEKVTSIRKMKKSSLEKTKIKYALENLMNAGIIVLDEIDFKKNKHYTIEYAFENKEISWVESFL